MLSGRDVNNNIISSNLKPRTSKKVTFASNTTFPVPPKDKRLTQASIRLGHAAGHSIGQQMQSIQSETRSAFNTPKKHHYNQQNGVKESHLQVSTRKNTILGYKPTKFQEFPAFSLRRSLAAKNKVIDGAQVPETIFKTKPPKVEEEKVVFVHKGISGFATAHNPGPTFNSFGLVKDLQDVFADDDDERFRFLVDMSGYHNNEISLRLKGTKLTVEGNRPQQEPWISKRKTTETVELPAHVGGDNLRIDRDTHGLLYFQEAWKF